MSYEGVLNWPPDHVLLADETLYLGTNEGEFGGNLFAFNTLNGQWSDVEEKWDSRHKPITGIRQSPSGEIWVTTGLAHLGLRYGDIWSLRTGEWHHLAHSTKPVIRNLNWPALSCDFESLAFDKQGSLYVLTGSNGVFRLDGSEWKNITPGWPAFVYCSDLSILSDGRLAIGTYDSGILVCESGKRRIRRIVLGHWPEWKD